MKIKNLLIVLFTFCLVINLFASEVGVEKASLVARNIYYEKANLYHVTTDFRDVIIKETFVKSSFNQNDYYVFTFAESGFVIVAAEDVISPVIGYSITSSYQEIDQPDSYRNFIQTYSDAILFIRNNNIQQSTEIAKLWDYFAADIPEIPAKSVGAKSVEPLVQSKWNQGNPYNAYCPESEEGPGGRVYAGCVATAMAQVMYYWRYPLQGTGSHTYYYPPYGNLSANFGATNYQWGGMKNTIDHQSPGPIAELQYHCGVAVDMMYGPNGSGAYSDDVPPALINYFGYSPDCYFSWKDNHSNTAWVNMLKENIDNGWPMYYSGYSSSGGHAFVCDGYQDEYFHFNFGWSGSSDGFYTLLTVNGFNDGQGAVFDTYPNSNYPYYCTGDHLITIKSGSFTDGSGPVEDYQDNVSCSWLIAPQTGFDSISNIKIDFISFETEINDLVIVYDGATLQDNVLGEFSGNELPPSLISSGNQVLIVFTSDGSGTANGWLAEFKSILPDYCQGILTFEEGSGSISDGSGDFNYQNSSVCMWKIIPEQAGTVTLNFSSFDTESNFDRLRVYDLETQELLADYSGYYSPSELPAPVTSPSGKMFLAFSTNPSITSQGWQVYYTSLTTGTENLSAINDYYRVYPNPATDKISIEVPQDDYGVLKIKLISLTGVVVISEEFAGSETNRVCELGLKDISRGVYLLQLTGSSEIITKRVIVQ
jgi:hypothetical protein